MLLNRPIPISFFFEKIKREALFIFIYVNVLFILKHYHTLDELNIPLPIPALLGTSISLLLAFRTNQAYERWWEARSIWGAIVNDSRTLIRQLQTFLSKSDIKEESIESFAQRQIAWCYVLGQFLRKKPTLHLIEKYLTQEDQEKVDQAFHHPLSLLQLHSETLHYLYSNGYLNSIEVTQIDSTLSRLTDSMGRCERIKNTIFPKTYTFYIQALIIIFTTLLPFGFAEKLFYIEVPVITIIASTFILIEKSAIQLQDPFENKPTDTPITSISQGIERSILQMIDKPIPFYLETPLSYYSL